MRSASSLIIGDRDDPHVRAVLDHLREDSILVLDADSLSRSQFIYVDNSFEIETDDGWSRIGMGGGGHRPRAWLRRLAPDGWQRGVEVGSFQAAGMTAWLGLLGALSRSDLFDWLSGIDDSLVAENKLLQLDMAKRIGVKTPSTIVTNSLAAVRTALPGARIVKPLGPSHFYQDGVPHLMYTHSADDSQLFDLRESPPLLIQERMEAVRHLRVVVVRDRVWAAALDAVDLPVDWRANEAAHDSFAATALSDEVRMGAVAINNALNLGYSSQDWIETDVSTVLVDVNPGGQWLFLPDPIGSQVAITIAEWLEDR